MQCISAPLGPSPSSSCTRSKETSSRTSSAACERRGAKLLDDAPLRHWLGHRNRVPSWESLLGNGLVVDTIEVAATWDRVGPLYGAVTEAIRAVPGILAASGHTSHGYTTGVNIYFTFAGASKEPQIGRAHV